MIAFYYQIKTQIDIEIQNSNKEFQLSQNLYQVIPQKI